MKLAPFLPGLPIMVCLVTWTNCSAWDPASDTEVSVIIKMRNERDLSQFRESDKNIRRALILDALKRHANQTQTPVLDLLRSVHGRSVTSLWIVNAIAATIPSSMISVLRRHPAVQSVTLDSVLKVPSTKASAPSLPEWNLTAINLPAAWAHGFDGSGAVVANMDTGVDLNHSDLKDKWRGGDDSWWDPYKTTAQPYDAIGHGTQTMGIMVGGSAGGSAIGVAPAAKWIAAKIYDDQGNTSQSIIHRAFQWLLSPSGNVGAPDAPDVVNAAWEFGTPTTCDTTFQADFDALRAAGIVVVFAGGNNGPSLSSSVSPANNVNAFSSGATDQNNVVTSFSSRGPSACDNGIYPDVVAPGVNVKTSNISIAGTATYINVTGTSFAAPHVAGAAALIAGAFPNATVASIEDSLRSTAIDLDAAGPDNNYGYGLIDADAAVFAMVKLYPPRPIVPIQRPRPRPNPPCCERVVSGSAP